MILARKSLISSSLWIAALLILLVAPRATVAQVCAVPGSDGPGGTLTGVINTYYPGTANASAGGTSISVGTPTGSSTPIAAGDLLLVIQMQDAAISYAANDNTYGDGAAGDPGSGWTNLNSSGRYEYVVATSTAGATVSIRGAGSGNGLVNSYNNAAASGTQGQRRFQVIRVPQYSTATLSSGLTARRWDGSTGGILVFDVAGALSLGSASINLDGYGFRGGGARQLAGGSGGSSIDFVNLASNLFHASKGEGIAGTPRFVFDPATSTVVDNTTEGYPGGSFARGAPGNAGGGGTDTDIDDNQENSGGGGGSNYGAGGKGGKTWQSNLDRGGHGGASFSSAAASNRMIMGGGGGAGTRNNSSGVMSSGGAGGGIVMFRAGTISGSATISVDGLDGLDAENDGGGGGGAGGSVLVSANSGGIGSLTINARGGNGADAWPLQAPGGTPGERHGPGGGGGGGFIAISGSATTNVSGGTNGITTTASDSYGATAGSAGNVLSISSSEALGASSGAACFPTLTTTKTTSTATVINTTSGTTATYSIVVSNAANRGSAINTSISDVLPSGFTFSSTTSVTLGGGATRPSTSNPTAGSATPAWGTFTIPGSGSVTIVFVANIASSVAAGTYQNPATATYSDPARTVSGGTLTSNYASGSSTGEDVLVTVRDMTITKSHVGNFMQGQVGAQYTLTATNSGTATTTGTVTVTDTLPAGLTPTAPIGSHNGWTCGIASQTVTCTRSNTLAAGLSYPTITITVTVANNATSVTNTANVSGGGEINTGNNSDSDPTTINPAPDLTIAKSHSGNFSQGQVGATYTLTATNSGLGPTTGSTVTVTDTLPAGLTPTAPIGAHNGWTCGIASQTLTCTRSDTVAAGSSYPTITVTVTVANNAAASVTNTATVSGGGQTNTGNDSASDPTTITQLADMTITKSHSGSFQQGQVGATYTLTARNSGFATTSGTVTVTDTLPAGLTPTGPIGAHNGWTCGIASQTLTCTRSDALAINTNYPTITVTVDVANNAAASVTNTASVSGGGQSNTTNDTDSDVTAVTQMPDLTVNKSHTGNFSQGQVGAQYSIVVTNSGFATTSGTVTVVDTLPAGLTPTGPTGTSGGWTCNIVGQTLTCTRSTTRGPGGSFQAINLTVNVAANAPASVTNTVTVSGGGQINTTNDTDSDPTTIVQPDLTIAKTHSGNFSQGQSGAQYTITVTNSGTASTNGSVVTVTDTLPAGLTPTGPIGAHNGWTCGIASQTLTCTRSTVLTAGSSYPTITLSVNVASSAPASVTNTVSVSGGGQTNTANDTASDPTTINHPDMTISKSHSGNFTQGQVGAQYTITATNSGLAATNGTTVTVTDTLPAGLTPTAPIGAHNGWTCGIASQTVTCTRTDVLAAGSNYPNITVTVTVANNAAASVTNSVSVSGGGQLDTTNDTDTDPTTITQLPDMTITKSHSGNFTQGQVGAQYTITATNSGNAATTGTTVTVTDTLPAGLTPTGPIGAHNGWTCGIASQTVTCTRTDVLAAGSSYPAITVTVNVANNAAASVTNSVSVSGGGQIITTNDTASDPTTINQLPDMTITKSHSGNFTQGQVGAQYTITATNSGNGATNGTTVTVTDTLPAGLTPTGPIGAHNGWTCGIASQTVTCTRSDALAAGASYPTITITVTVANNAAASVTNSVAVSGGGQIITSNDTASDPTTIDQLPDMTITKSHSGNFTQGQVGAQYTITATNSGSASTNGTTVTVADTLPAGLTPTGPIGAHNGWTCGIASQTVTCTRSNVLAAGASYPTITVTVTVANNAPASVTNSVSVSGGGQTNTSNDSASDPTTINQLPDMTITKSHTGNFTQGQVGAQYTITATNSGSASTNGTTVTVTDTLPAGLTPTGPIGAHNGWTCGIASQTVTCTRSDALAASASYPAITLTVNVANNAPASVTNSVAVSGGGQIITTNDTATDPTTINAGPPVVSLVKSVNPSGTQVPGSDLTYTIDYTNTGGKPASSFIIIDPNMANADPLERVFHNLDFKVGSMTSTPGTSGLVAAFSYSNDGGVTWTYTPVSGGGGAPAGYDRNVTNIRWTFAGNLSHVSPNNAGSVGFVARIR